MLRPPGRRVSVRPTARGWQAIFFGSLSLVAALLIGTTQIYQLAYAFAGLLLAALVLGLFFSRGLRYARRIPGERSTVGRSSHVELTVSNASRTRSPNVEVLDHLPERRPFRGPPVGGFETRKIREPVLFAKRGFYKLGPAEIRTTDPFGLLRFIRRFGARTEVTVYPEVFELAGFLLRGKKGDAGTRGSFAQRGDEFSGLREYRRGDDRRHIDWKSVARTGELVVKEFAQESPQRHTVVLDLHRPGIGVTEAEIEDAVSAAGSVLYHLVREGLPFRLISRSLGDGLVESVEKLRAAGLSTVVVALAAHTYRTGGLVSGREGVFSGYVRRLELAGADVRVVRRPGGVAALAGSRRVANSRGAV
ncbi:MAG: DUF58 domain-containing protein [Actinobacteria bacterium]|nr:DUF58 domain-containing protein [Actinomycetota bacterium]